MGGRRSHMNVRHARLKQDYTGEEMKTTNRSAASVVRLARISTRRPKRWVTESGVDVGAVSVWCADSIATLPSGCTSVCCQRLVDRIQKFRDGKRLGDADLSPQVKRRLEELPTKGA